MALRFARALRSCAFVPARLVCSNCPVINLSPFLRPFTNYTQNVCSATPLGLPQFSVITRSVKTGLSPDAVTQKVLEVCSGFEKIPGDKVRITQLLYCFTAYS